MRAAPAWTLPYLQLSRVDRPIGTWLLLLPCWWGALLATASQSGPPPASALWTLAACAIGAALMRGAGCTWNDINDREFDAKVARTRDRPLPAGRISPKSAAAWAALQTLLAAAVLMTLNKAAIIAGIAALIPAAVYPFAKRFTWWPQVFLGIAFNWGALLGWAAQTGSVGAPAVALYAAGILWTLFYDTIYAHQDTEDDGKIGVRSTARLFNKNTKAWLLLFMLASPALAGLACWMAIDPAQSPAKLAIMAAGAACFCAHLAWQLKTLKPESPELCLRLFRSNRDSGLIMAAFLAIAALM